MLLLHIFLINLSFENPITPLSEDDVAKSLLLFDPTVDSGLKGCRVSRASYFCNPDGIMDDDDVESLLPQKKQLMSLVWDPECHKFVQIGVFISKAPYRNNSKKATEARKALGNAALKNWFIDCPLDIIYVMHKYPDDRIECSGFRGAKTERLVNFQDLNDVCKNQMNKTHNIMWFVESVITNTGKLLILKEKEKERGKISTTPPASGGQSSPLTMMIGIAVLYALCRQFHFESLRRILHNISARLLPPEG